MVLGLPGLGLCHVGEIQALLKVHVQAAVDQVFDQGMGLGWTIGQPSGQLHGRLHQLVVGHHLAGNAQPVRLYAVDAVAGVLEQQRVAHPDESGQLPARAVAGNETHARERLGEYRALGGDADVAGQGHAHANAHGVPVDGSDGRLLQLVDAQRHQGSATGVLHSVVAIGEAGLHFAPGQGLRFGAGRLGLLDVPVEIPDVGAGAE